MTESELRRLSPALAKYLDEYLFCCGHTQTFGHLGTYVRGLLSDLKRKTCEPIALKAGTPVRTRRQPRSESAQTRRSSSHGPVQPAPPR